jgi:hypothetical protein
MEGVDTKQHFLFSKSVAEELVKSESRSEVEVVGLGEEILPALQRLSA